VSALLGGPRVAPPVSDHVPTGCDPLDDLLNGGFERGAVTQLYGPPASGKTNVVLAGAVEAAAAGGSALFIDTEGLPIDRLEQLASARTGPDLSVDDIAGRIMISEAHTWSEQQEAVQDAADFAEQVDLIVLDSATGFYRLERTEQAGGEALRAVARQITHLLSLARKHDLAVAFTNQVFTDPEAEKTRALGGNTLDHWSAIIVRLDRFRGGKRRARLEKHHSKEVGEAAQFQITGDGLAAGGGKRL
jgi:DNA repair protein RadB